MNIVNQDMVKVLFDCGCGMDKVLTFMEWQKLGKIVKKGEKALKIHVLIHCEQGDKTVTKEWKSQVFCSCQVIDNPMKKD